MKTAGPVPIAQPRSEIYPAVRKVGGAGTVTNRRIRSFRSQGEAGLGVTPRAPWSIRAVAATGLSCLSHHGGVAHPIGDIPRPTEAAILKHRSGTLRAVDPVIADVVVAIDDEVVTRSKIMVRGAGREITRTGAQPGRIPAGIGRAGEDCHVPIDEGCIISCVAACKGPRRKSRVIVERLVEVQTIVQGRLIQERQEQHQAVQVHDDHAGVVARRGVVTSRLSQRRGRKDSMRVEIVVQSQPKLLHVVLTAATPGGLPCLLDRRQQQGNQNGDDGNDHQQLNQRETPFLESIIPHDPSLQS